MAERTVVDATGFLGMHHTDMNVREDWKSFFVDRLDGRLAITLEEIGRCDEHVWRAPRAVQDDYYPFMDTLHTEADIVRDGYVNEDLAAATDPALRGLSARQRLLIGFARRHDWPLVTADPQLLRHPGLPVMAVPPGRPQARFPEPLEALYLRSLVLQVSDLDDRAGRPPAGR